MTIFISGRFTPLRMVLSRKEPVQISLYIKNEGEEKKKLTVKIVLSSQLAFSKGGFKNSDLVRIDSLKPEEEKTLYFNLYPKSNTEPGEQSIQVRVQEHSSNYQYTKKQHEKTLSLKVEK